MSFWDSLSGSKKTIRVNELPKNPVKGKVYEVPQNGRKLGYLATGQEGFGKWRLQYNESI